MPMAVAGGTLKYIGIYDLLPEAFHEKHDQYRPFVLVVLGIAAMYVQSKIMHAPGI